MNKELDTIYVKPAPQQFTYFIDSDITEPSDYRELIQVLTSMSEDDTLELLINCHGGFLHTTTYLSNAIRNCRGHVHGILSGVAMSGGSLLLLSCHSVEVMPHSVFMAHTSNGIEAGKLSDTTRSLTSSVKQLEALYKDLYWGFYTEQEINDILEGKDSYLEYEEINRRLQVREELMKDANKQAQEDAYNEMQAMFEDENDVPLDVLAKVTKADLIRYISGEIDIMADENGKPLIVELDIDKPE